MSTPLSRPVSISTPMNYSSGESVLWGSSASVVFYLVHRSNVFLVKAGAGAFGSTAPSVRVSQ